MTNPTGLPNSMDMTTEIRQEVSLAINSISSKLTIVMPVRIDSDERKANLHAVLSHVSRLGCRVLVLEAQKVGQFFGQFLDLISNPCFSLDVEKRQVFGNL